MNVVNVAQKLSLVDKHWSPRIIAELNGQHVKVAKLLGEFDWHFHENEDELFWVVNGQLTIHMRGSSVQLGPGELFVVPRGVEHKPEALEEVEVVLFEPAATLNTGNVTNKRTVNDVPRI